MRGYPKGKTAKYVVQVLDYGAWRDLTQPIANRNRAFLLRDRLNALGNNTYRVFNRVTRSESLDHEGGR
jgi:hypothetical protein